MNEYRSGFVSIIGCPNVGKSTLINCLVGQKIAIVSDRAQTTRNKITGVLTEKDHQIVFLDTPGIIAPKNKLGEYMYQVSEDAMSEVEGILFVIDGKSGLGDRDRSILQRLGRVKSPVFGIINKCDLLSEEECGALEDELHSFDVLRDVLKISALQGTGVKELKAILYGIIPEGPMYFPEDMVTDQPERIICGEIIREKTLQLLREEVPHGIGVSIDKMEQRTDRDMMDVWATVLCERESHKGIIIGKGGKMLKKIGSESRKDMEWLLGCRVNLQIWIKVKEDWRNRQAVIKELGYE